MRSCEWIRICERMKIGVKNMEAAAERMGRITMIDGPVVRASGLSRFAMGEMTEVGELALMGEILQMDGDSGVVQVYEDTTGLRVGEPVLGLGRPLSVCLGPGLVGHIIDGIGRPLDRLMEKEGSFLGRGSKLDPIDMSRSWEVTPTCKVGDRVCGGSVIAELQETDLVTHRVLVPYGLEGEVEFIVASGFCKTSDVVARVRRDDGTIVPVMMYHYWPVRRPRPYRDRLLPDEPLVTGQRVIDGLFPISKGGVAAIPGRLP